jgi:hypothetical protein
MDVFVEYNQPSSDAQSHWRALLPDVAFFLATLLLLGNNADPLHSNSFFKAPALSGVAS